MPLSINVGLSRKASKDYQSTGVSINVTAELDQSLLAKPDQLQQQVHDLYHQARQALDHQAEANRSQPRNGSNNGGQRHNGNGKPAAMTDSQRRAIAAIADRLHLDPQQEIREQFGWDIDHLTVRQASEVIDYLKGPQPANGNGGGR